MKNERMSRTFAPPPRILFSGQSPFGAAREAEEIYSLVSSVLTSALAGINHSLPGVIELETLSGGRSGAYVFKATPLAADGRTRGGVPAAIKVAPLDAGTSERANYDRFVRPLLPPPYRPDLRGFATAHRRAAICYSFVGDGERPQTLTDRLAAGDLAALDMVLSSTFETLRQCWYDARQVQKAGVARYYLERYFEDLISATATETILFGHAARYFNAQQRAGGYRIDKIVFPSICDALLAGGDMRPFTSCILHGDLNSDNVVLDRGGTLAALVDFQRTGYGHVFQDLASLEASVRINYPAQASFGDILEIERLIALDDPAIRGNSYAMAIRGIRDTARRSFRLDEAAGTYQCAVAAIGLRLMKATDLTDAARARLVASALWSARMLVQN